MKVSGQLHATGPVTLFPGKEAQVRIGWELGWSPQPMVKKLIAGNSGNRTSFVTIPTEQRMFYVAQVKQDEMRTSEFWSRKQNEKAHMQDFGIDGSTI